MAVTAVSPTRSQVGMTLIELILVLAVAGILLAVGGARLNASGSSTSQAAQVVAGAANRARFEAVKTNSTSGLEIVAGSGGTSGSTANPPFSVPSVVLIQVPFVSVLGSNIRAEQASPVADGAIEEEIDMRMS